MLFTYDKRNKASIVYDEKEAILKDSKIVLLFDRRKDMWVDVDEAEKPKNKLCLHWLDCSYSHCPHSKLHKDVDACHSPCHSIPNANESCLDIEVKDVED
jgi:hypothetical protein